MNFIHRIPKAYSHSSCNKLINWFEKNIDKSFIGKTGEGIENINDLELNLLINNYEDYFGLGKTLFKSINNFKKKYSLIDKYINKWSMNKNVLLMKYKPNNFYNLIHCENDGSSPNLKRVFAFMIFLNNIKKGGGTKFIFQNLTIKPKAGDFYIWPAGWTHLHQGVNAPKENKYILTGWVDFI